MIVQLRTSGSLKDDDDLFDFFINQLREMADTFARTVAQLTLLTLEKAFNAIAQVIWGVINTALQGAAFAVLPIPRAPVV